MKHALKAAGVLGAIAVIAAIIKWDYIIYFMNASFQAAEHIVAGKEKPVEFEQAIDTLSISQFIDISFFDEYMEQNGIEDEDGGYVTMEKTVKSILGEE